MKLVPSHSKPGARGGEVEEEVPELIFKRKQSFDGFRPCPKAMRRLEQVADDDFRVDADMGWDAGSAQRHETGEFVTLALQERRHEAHGWPVVLWTALKVVVYRVLLESGFIREHPFSVFVNPVLLGRVRLQLCGRTSKEISLDPP
jgi:hypothetical protein